MFGEKIKEGKNRKDKTNIADGVNRLRNASFLVWTPAASIIAGKNNP